VWTASARRRAPCTSSVDAIHIVICASYSKTHLSHGGGDTLAERYEQNILRLERIEQDGYQVKVPWECEFQPPEGVKVEEHLPLSTRDAMYGGSTEAMRIYYKIKEGEETIQYVDVMSVHPWVCKYFKFPVGHSTIQMECGDIPTMLAKEGLVRCTLLPPRGLYQALLPYMCIGRLIFRLCRSCEESGSQEQCRHESSSDRVPTATWVVDDLRASVERDYCVLKIHEMYVTR
jgi:hypothetical protein